MEIDRGTSWIGFAVITLATVLLSSNPAQSQQTTFSCDNSSGVPTTIAHSPKHGDISIIKWVSDDLTESGYDPQTRCDQVSARFQEYHSQGKLNYLTTGRINRESVICATEAENQPCNLLFTIKKTSNPGATLQKLIDVRSSSTSQALTETNDRVYVDFNSLIEEKAKQEANSNPPSVPEASIEPQTESRW
jgi:hypothetical protein